MSNRTENLQLGDCVEIRTGKPWLFEGATGRLKSTFKREGGSTIAVIQMDDGFLARCKLDDLIPRHTMACWDISQGPYPKGEFE